MIDFVVRFMSRKSVIIVILSLVAVFLGGKFYQHMDRDPQRGAIAVNDSYIDGGFNTPVYLDQGWGPSDSLWYYNVTQGTNIIPFDIFLSLEEPDSTEKNIKLFRRNANLDRYRYLLQQPTFFNPEGLPVGFVKDTYKGKDYLGVNCAACHTAQVQFKGEAIRIEGGPAAADLDTFLRELHTSMTVTLGDDKKLQRFTQAVLARNGFKRRLLGGRDYSHAEAVRVDLELWSERLASYNDINESEHSIYGFARLDAFGRIYNRVLKHVVNKRQAREQLSLVRIDGQVLLSTDQIEQVLDGLNEVILGRDGFDTMVRRLTSSEAEYPNLSKLQMKEVYRLFFNPADAPVSYPYLWDAAQSDYVQWNGLQSNSGVGALGRNTGQVIGVFANLDWQEGTPHWYNRLFSLSAWISGQNVRNKKIDFESSVNGVNLTRMEAQLKRLNSPLWPESILGSIDAKKYAKGKILYAQYCVSCHEPVERKDWDRKITAKLIRLDKIGTDSKMADNAVTYVGRSGNLGKTYQSTDVGSVLVADTAPVRQLLTAVTAGVMGTPDRDKWPIRRLADWVYMFASSFFSNSLQASVKSGDYEPDTTAAPYASLRAYKARPLNGIWATAPYLHNGSVPSLYDLLLPSTVSGSLCLESKESLMSGNVQQFRPNQFLVGSREFDPVKVGFNYLGYEAEGFKFDTSKVGNSNTGHEYAAGHSRPLRSEEPLPPLCDDRNRWALVEYLKTL